MLRFQSSLPKLPVPELSSTSTKYLESVRPHLTPSTFAATKSAVDEFIASDAGKELQARLQARAAEPGRDSWLADWWNEAAYMGYRDPVVVFVSYFYVHLDDKRTRDPASRAASLIKALLPFRDLVESYVTLWVSFLRIAESTIPLSDSSLSPRRSGTHPCVCRLTNGCECIKLGL